MRNYTDKGKGREAMTNELKELSIDYTQIELRMLTLTAIDTQNVFTYTAQDKVLKFGLAYGASPKRVRSITQAKEMYVEETFYSLCKCK
jgi:hypothetical protein